MRPTSTISSHPFTARRPIGIADLERRFLTVQMRGRVQATAGFSFASPPTVLTIPEGYRPEKGPAGTAGTILWVNGDDGTSKAFYRAVISTAGVMVIDSVSGGTASGASSTFLYLWGVAWQARETRE